jgi:hypothetical protein
MCGTRGARGVLSHVGYFLFLTIPPESRFRVWGVCVFGMGVFVCYAYLFLLLVRPVRLAHLRGTVFVRWLLRRSFSYGDTVPITVVVNRVLPLSSLPCYLFDFFAGVHTLSRTWVFGSGS